MTIVEIPFAMVNGRAKALSVIKFKRLFMAIRVAAVVVAAGRGTRTGPIIPSNTR